MKQQPFWRTAAVATCFIILGCGRNPPTAPERSADAVPAPQPVVAAVSLGEHSDPSLVDSSVTAGLDANAPWTASESTTQEQSPARPDESQQATAPGMDQNPQSDAQRALSQQSGAPADESAGAVSSPQAPSSPQAVVESPTQELAKSGESSRTSTN